MPKPPSKKVLRDLHYRMLRIRIFEEKAGRLAEDGKIPGALHLYVGQEAVAAGFMVHLSAADQITSTHRGHGHLVAKGGDFAQMYAELYGRSTGYCRGKGGSMHIADMDLGMLGANGIVGAGPPIAAGAAFTNRYLKNGNVAVTFFGDGASNEGAFHEAANLAAVYKLPLILVCENNGYGEFTPQDQQSAVKDIADRAVGYGMPGVIVDGMDAVAVYETAAAAVERARAGGGPTLVEAKTYRYFDHVGLKGMGLSYRTDEEVEEWKKRDPIQLLEARLTEQDVLTHDQISEIYSQIEAEADEAIQFATDSPHPEPELLLQDVYYVPEPGAKVENPLPIEPETEREGLYVSAITEGTRAALAEFSNAYLLGEDVAGAGSVFGFYKGLLKEFGGDRVIDTPISEAGIMGLGVGSAATGCRPIIDIMFMDFLGECMDEVTNQMAKMRYMFGGKAKLPVTVMTMAGAGMNMAAQHSQSLENWFCHLPGIKVVMPSTPYDAKGLIIAAVREENPVFVVMNKMSLAIKGKLPEEPYVVPIGKARIARPGTNFTIVATGRMVHEALKAAESLAEDGLDVEVIDPRTLQPFDTETVVESVRKTHRALIVHEAVRFSGFGAEIAAQIQELAFDYLDAPVARVGAPFSPVPYSPKLEKLYVPNAKKIAAEAKRIIGL